AGTNATGSNQCRRAPTAYAPLLAEHPPPGVPPHVVFLACSGAKTIDLTGENQYPEEPTYDVAVPSGGRPVLGQLAVLDVLGDHRICDGPRTHIAVNFLRLNGVTGPFEDRINPKNWLHNNLHPNEEGHALIRDAIVRWLDAHPLASAPEATANQSGSVPDIA